jgi:hypothetical protein
MHVCADPAAAQRGLGRLPDRAERGQQRGLRLAAEQPDLRHQRFGLFAEHAGGVSTGSVGRVVVANENEFVDVKGAWHRVRPVVDVHEPVEIDVHSPRHRDVGPLPENGDVAEVRAPPGRVHSRWWRRLPQREVTQPETFGADRGQPVE